MASKHVRLLKDLASVDETFQADRLFSIKKKIDASTYDAIHETDLTHPVFIYSPQQSPYIGGEFELEISLPLDYPSTTPRVKFRTPIYSPIVDESGALSCLPILQRWLNYPLNSHRLSDILSGNRLLHHPSRGRRWSSSACLTCWMEKRSDHFHENRRAANERARQAAETISPQILVHPHRFQSINLVRLLCCLMLSGLCQMYF